MESDFRLFSLTMFLWDSDFVQNTFNFENVRTTIWEI